MIRVFCAAIAGALLTGGPLLALTRAQALAPPDDPRYVEQWALPMIGAPCAWQHTTGSRRVTVAVVDSGVDPSHPDLVGRLRADGYDFVDDDPRPVDENGHGTHVSGIIAATLDNAEGGAGLAPGIHILPVRTMNAEGWGSNRAIAAGIRYATERGADIINISLGSTLWTSRAQADSPEIDAIREALDAGVLVVVAAGNDFVPLPNVIAFDNPDVLLVAASNDADTRAPFSNAGPWVDVTAPGQHIFSTLPTYEVYLTSEALPLEERFDRNYDYMSGTSQAAPYVAALAALLLTSYPDASAADLQAMIEASADQGIYQNQPAEHRRLWELGTGRIDACAALHLP